MNPTATRVLAVLEVLCLLVVLGVLLVAAAVLARELGLTRRLDNALTVALFGPPDADPPGWVEPSAGFLAELRAWCAASDGVPTRDLSPDEFRIYQAWMRRYAPGLLGPPADACPSPEPTGAEPAGTTT
jgi:hypothetical protein